MSAKNRTCNPPANTLEDRVWQKHLNWRNHAVDPSEAVDVDTWLDSPEGQAWLNGEAEKDRFQRNGFNDLEAFDYAAMPAIH
jgi:hypothetical protein